MQSNRRNPEFYLKKKIPEKHMCNWHRLLPNLDQEVERAFKRILSWAFGLGQYLRGGNQETQKPVIRRWSYASFQRKWKSNPIFQEKKNKSIMIQRWSKLKCNVRKYTEKESVWS